MKNNDPELTVLDRNVIHAGQLYQLRELPHGVNFKHKGGLYRTVTYPKYNTAGMNASIKTRPCLNLRSLHNEEIGFAENVKVV